MFLICVYLLFTCTLCVYREHELVHAYSIDECDEEGAEEGEEDNYNDYAECVATTDSISVHSHDGNTTTHGGSSQMVTTSSSSGKSTGIRSNRTSVTVATTVGTRESSTVLEPSIPSPRIAQVEHMFGRILIADDSALNR